MEKIAKGILAIVVSAVMLAQPLRVRAEDGAQVNEDCIVTDQLVGELLDWVSDHTKYDVATVRSDVPEISFCRTGDNIVYHDEHMIVESDTEALYDTRNRKIYLVGTWNADRPNDVSVLLHELIHAVQFDNRTWRCLGQPEWEAYKLQEKWLAERGIKANFDWLVIYMISRCTKDIHP